MKKIKYKTSKIYEELVDLIRDGHEVVCFLHDNQYIQLAYAKSEESELYEKKMILSIVSQGAGYIQEYNDLDFIECCKNSSLEFIQPDL